MSDPLRPRPASRPLFNECPCGAAISIPLAHPQCSELAGRFDDEHRPHRIEAARALLGDKTGG
jgi:hypothetical protein